MFEKLKELIDNSYSIYSKYKVACIVKMKDGTLFEGVNIENPSFKDGLCAEQVAIGSAISDGYKKGDFDKIYLLGDSAYAITPCFLCRQVILEFFEDENEVISFTENGKEKVFLIKDLCPHAFSEKELNNDK